VHRARPVCVGLLDLAFFKVDVLARNRIVFLENQLFRARARVLLGHVEVACAGRAEELDLLGCWLRHGSGLVFVLGMMGAWLKPARLTGTIVVPAF
jgi:hypothetical protein